MFGRNWSEEIRRLQRRWNGATVTYNLEKQQHLVNSINSLAAEFASETESNIKQTSRRLRETAQNEAISEHLLVPAFALVRETVRRVLHITPFDVQLIGAVAMHEGHIVEMQTGEGKTLAAVFPAYLNALTGQGVHILTFNDYLARRDAEWMGPIYRYLGLAVGHVQEGMSKSDRQRAYAADVTYLTAKEAGFDFLRDSLVYAKDDLVQRDFHFAIVDEADSILIDEARVPLVIAGATGGQMPETLQLASFVRGLRQFRDFDYDEYARNIHLTDAGVNRAETTLLCANLFAEENADLLAKLSCALHAEFLLQPDIDYIVRDGRIELVDEFTGRVADKRRWPDGLQAALEVKEGLTVQKQGQILNSITLQHFLQHYPKIAGMTATAEPSAAELRRFYGLEVVVIPPNRPCVRVDHPDVLFANLAEKHKALVDEISEVHKTSRPILVGTASVRESVQLAEMLQAQGIQCEVLNAKQDALEAEIIAQAGKLNAVTISTNMAGRGTDIRLGGADEEEKQRVAALGGLYVIGTNRHESRRIDQQLRGRAGRQGDPGSSRFFISLEDDLFVKYNLEELLPVFAPQNENEINETSAIREEIDRVQRIIEGQNLEIKKTLTKYAAIVEQQREIVFSKREDVLESPPTAFFATDNPARIESFRTSIPAADLDKLCQKIMLHCIDRNWADYLAQVAEIREGIHLHRLGGQNPYFEFQKIVVKSFDEMLQRIETEANELLEKAHPPGTQIQTPSATWTYLVNDDPFENVVGPSSIANINLAGAGVFGLLLGLKPALEKLGRKKRKRN